MITLSEFVALDLPPLLTAIFSSLACGLLGNYLVLRRQSLMGDAISHSVLPGMVVAFLVTSSRDGVSIFVGAALAGILSAFFIELVRRFGRVESGAAMGVVFSVFFALGVLLMEQAAARSVDLDADCLLHGQLESIFWYPPVDPPLFSISTLSLLPVEVVVAFVCFLLVLGFITLCYKELRLTSFDPALAASLGFRPDLMHQVLMAAVACAVVASFKVVGSILVIAMIICPAATARMCTDRLVVQLLLSGVFSVISCIVGYLAAAFGPGLLGFENSLSASGSIAVASGVLFAAAVLLAPQYGVIVKAARRARLRLRVVREDILGMLFRVSEQNEALRISRENLRDALGETTRVISQAMRELLRAGLVAQSDGSILLTSSGKAEAMKHVRSHRLWEYYLVQELGLPADHVHPSAESLEHFTDTELRTKLSQEGGGPSEDPHGRVIPGSDLGSN